MELNDLPAVLDGLTWYEWAGVAWSVQAFVRGNFRNIRNLLCWGYSGVCWACRKVAAWWRRPSRTTLLEKRQEALFVQQKKLLEALGEKVAVQEWDDIQIGDAVANGDDKTDVPRVSRG